MSTSVLMTTVPLGHIMDLHLFKQNWTIRPCRPPSWILKEVDFDHPAVSGSLLFSYTPNLMQIFSSTVKILPGNEIQNGGQWRLTSTSGSGIYHKAIYGVT